MKFPHAVITAFVAGAAAFAVDFPHYETAVGVLLGMMTSYAKTRLNTVILTLLVNLASSRQPATGSRYAFKAALLQIGSQALNFIILLVCIRSSLRLFAGCAAGMVFLPALLTIFSRTRKTLIKSSIEKSTKEYE
ncbi:MAG: hypothetical protein LBD20_04680 [Spirochaetaceae bacterium]|jgi:hypothetical protein|nr:hypothetical protein [Spirochaetaceae bacterium]